MQNTVVEFAIFLQNKEPNWIGEFIKLTDCLNKQRFDLCGKLTTPQNLTLGWLRNKCITQKPLNSQIQLRSFDETKYDTIETRTNLMKTTAEIEYRLWYVYSNRSVANYIWFLGLFTKKNRSTHHTMTKLASKTVKSGRVSLNIAQSSSRQPLHNMSLYIWKT